MDFSNRSEADYSETREKVNMMTILRNALIERREGGF